MRFFWKPLVAIAVIALQFASPSTARADLLGYWPFDEGSGTTAADRSGNGNTGELSDTASWANGRIGGALDLGDFNNSAWVEIPSAADGAFDSIVDTQSATVTFWMNRLGAAAVNQWTFDFDGGASSSDPVVGRQFSSHAPWGNNNIYLDTGGCCGANQRINSDMGTASTDGQWHHLAYVRDVEDTRIYIDGVLHLESAPGAVTSPVSPIIRAGIGATADGAASHVGLIDEFAIWDEALPLGRIVGLAEGGPVIADQGLLGDFNGDEVVDTADWQIMLSNFHGVGVSSAEGDINFDRKIDLRDFIQFRDVFTAANPAGAVAASVPEPGSILLFGLGLLLLGRRRRRAR